MAKKLSPELKQRNALVQKLANLMREESVLGAKMQLNSQLRAAVMKELDIVDKSILQGVNSELTYEERQIAPSNKIVAIKMVRERCHNGLLEAKEMVDRFLAAKVL